MYRVNQDQQDLRDQQVFLASRESQETLVDLAIRGQWGNRDLRGWTGSRESEEARALLEDQDPQDLKVLPVIEDYQDFLDLQDLPVSAANGELRLYTILCAHHTGITTILCVTSLTAQG
ncbi:hypothetical protein J6590_092014 [Homalodisca vitripennis]|nr:hypothetical protein J6590_092014 [Homalodisca vitripennis]